MFECVVSVGFRWGRNGELLRKDVGGGWVREERGEVFQEEKKVATLGVGYGFVCEAGKPKKKGGAVCV